MRICSTLLSAAFVLSACSGSDAAGDGGSPREDAGPMVSPDDAGLDAGDAGENPVPEGVLRTSRVFANSYDFRGVQNGGAGAQFFDQDPSPLATRVEPLEGNCVLRESELLANPGEGAFPQFRDAGFISITGGRAPIQIMRGTFYEFVASEEALWDAGDTLVVSAPGGADIGPFTATLEAPTRVVVTSPTLPLGGAPPLEVARTSPLTLTWTGDASGDEVLVIVAGDTGDTAGSVDRSVECRFEPAAATATLPAAVMGRLDGGTGFVIVDVVSQREVAVPGWGAVRIELTASGVVGTGNRFVARANIN
ncbi:MAG: hypothetical protein AAF447_09010 [Myxococcota bacterium]